MRAPRAWKDVKQRRSGEVAVPKRGQYRNGLKRAARTSERYHCAIYLGACTHSELVYTSSFAVEKSTPHDTTDARDPAAMVVVPNALAEPPSVALAPAIPARSSRFTPSVPPGSHRPGRIFA